jgi:site-specific DNA recombinase
MPMSLLRVALYARVSSEQQATAQTVASQLAELRARIAADGLVLAADDAFVDEGYSGATVVRPALERLRDLVAAGSLGRLYVHSPDRLARRYAYQVLLVEEWQRAGVEIVFLNRALGETPEDALLLQMQGMIAEYERAKILERHAAQVGAVSVLSGAPYGYRYIGKHDGGGAARYEILLEEARVVRQVFDWVGRERLSIGEVSRRLRQAGERTRTGKTVWDRSTVWAMLKNPAYQGTAAFGKTHETEMQPRLRAQRGRSLQPRRAHSTVDVPAEDWQMIPVPALVSAEVFATVAAQLTENRQRARQGQRGARYLLQGLVVCARCGYAYYGKPVSTSSAHGKPRHYAYYRCVGTDAYRFGGQRVCDNKQVRTDLLETAVWAEVCTLLEHPQRVIDEYQRRLQNPEQDPGHSDRATVAGQITKLRGGMGRLIDSYAEGVLTKAEFDPRIIRWKERLAHLEAQAAELADAAALQSDLRLIVGQLEDFAAQVQGNLADVDWATQRAMLRAVVKRVEVDQGQVNVVFRIAPQSEGSGSDTGFLHHCGRGGISSPREYRLAWTGN